jgi:hypothetical protein
MRSLKKTTTLVALGATLSLGLAACGGDSDTESTGSGSESSSSAAAEPSASPEPVAAIDDLDGVDTAVTLDPAFVEGITGLGLTPGVTGGATFDAATGTVSFPISGGEVTYFDPTSGVTPYVQGQINHEMAGLTLTGGGKVVELSDFVVDPGESVLTGTVSVDGAEAVASAPLFFLDGSTLKPLQTEMTGGTGNGVGILEGTTVSLTAEAAELLNSTFGVDALTEFFPVGIAKITVALPAS